MIRGKFYEVDLYIFICKWWEIPINIHNIQNIPDYNHNKTFINVE